MTLRVHIGIHTMSVTPMSRHIMRGLKAKNDETNRINQIQQFVSQFYKSAIITAKTTTDTVYQCTLRQHIAGTIGDNSENIQEIVRDLQILFPECSVEYKNLAWHQQERKLYDISKIDDTNRKFIDTRMSEKYIVIDWS